MVAVARLAGQIFTVVDGAIFSPSELIYIFSFLAFIYGLNGTHLLRASQFWLVPKISKSEITKAEQKIPL